MNIEIPKRPRVAYVPGTKASPQLSQPVLSTGISSLDSLLGGGLPLGSVLLIEEDGFGPYAKLFLQYFLVEGITCHHELWVASRDCVPESLLRELPGRINEESGEAAKDTGEKMQIAWRYQNLSSDGSRTKQTNLAHAYDLTTRISPQQLEKAKYTCWQPQGIGKESYDNLLQALSKKITELGSRNVLRIGIHSVGSLLWEDDGKKLAYFLYMLRSLIRSSPSVAVITIPSQDASRLRHLCDVAVRLESFQGSRKETNPLFKDYHGLFYLNKLPSMGCLAPPQPDSFDLAFKVRRKKLHIETLHLPPDLSETASRTQEDPVKPVASKIPDF